jgi:pantoate--beta-alanine ligase
VLIFKTKKALTAHISELKNEGKRIGLVPTMGALHQGHLSLLGFIKGYCDIRVCSIFVNPTQFNNAEDLEKYPRPVEHDIRVLKEAQCDILFLPEVEEMYGEPESWHIDLGNLDSILEGAFRAGHFQGVTQIVHKLFTLVRPDVACFGQKDYQQFAVIQKMVTDLQMPVSLVLCPIIREADGLAMSSRNVRLSTLGRKHALALYNSLEYFRKNVSSENFQLLKREVAERLKANTEIEFEYFEICHPADLSPLQSVQPGATVVALVAAWVDDVRLIDNMLIEIAQ